MIVGGGGSGSGGAGRAAAAVAAVAAYAASSSAEARIVANSSPRRVAASRALAPESTRSLSKPSVAPHRFRLHLGHLARRQPGL